MWWIIAAVVLVVFWYFVIRYVAPGINMVIHAYAISYERKHRIFAKVLGKGIDVLFYLSLIYVVGVMGACVYNYFK